MARVSRGLPERPHLDIPKREARELLNLWRKGDCDGFGGAGFDAFAGQPVG